jgi:cell cycle arrest protein BUB3
MVPLLRAGVMDLLVSRLLYRQCVEFVCTWNECRVSLAGMCTHISPFLSLSFCPFFSLLVLWDGLNKKKLATLPPFPTSISALAFSPDGTELAMASSYTFEDGERAHPHDEIYVRKILDHECQPKLKE